MSGDTEDTKELTIFSVGKAERQVAIDSFLSGKTGKEHIRHRPARGGGEVEYVSTYYMTRMMNLLTGFKWTSECVEEKARPNWETPIEIMCKMKVTTWDNNGRALSHTAWGTKDVAYYKTKFTKDSKAPPKPQIIALGDDLKAAYSDGIKKCLSYFGIADDVYGGKEAELYVEEETVELKPVTPKAPLPIMEEEVIIDDKNTQA